MKLSHPDDPKAKVTVTEDQAQAYLASGWVEVAPAPSKDEKK
jgi:hypothetical protein